MLDKELNLTEYEQNVRAAHGFPNSGSAIDDGNLSFNKSSTDRPKGGSLASDAAPQFGLESNEKSKSKHSSSNIEKYKRAMSN